LFHSVATPVLLQNRDKSFGHFEISHLDDKIWIFGHGSHTPGIHCFIDVWVGQVSRMFRNQPDFPAAFENVANAIWATAVQVNGVRVGLSYQMPGINLTYFLFANH
jgi:hypothetical protein